MRKSEITNDQPVNNSAPPKIIINHTENNPFDIVEKVEPIKKIENNQPPSP